MIERIDCPERSNVRVFSQMADDAADWRATQRIVSFLVGTRLGSAKSTPCVCTPSGARKGVNPDDRIKKGSTYCARATHRLTPATRRLSGESTRGSLRTHRPPEISRDAMLSCLSNERTSLILGDAGGYRPGNDRFDVAARALRERAARSGLPESPPFTVYRFGARLLANAAAPKLMSAPHGMDLRSPDAALRMSCVRCGDRRMSRSVSHPELL